MPDTTPKHSPWGASKFEQIMLCPGSTVLQQDLPNTTSKYAAEGTAAHQVLTRWALQGNQPAADFIGANIVVDEFDFDVDEDMARHVQVCVDYVRDVAGDDGTVLVDQRVDYSDYLGLPAGSAYGTLDVAILKGEEIISLDFKYGMGVEVSAERNVQVSLYALGILAQVNGLLGDFTSVRLAISQPRTKAAVSEYAMTVEELEAWGRGAARSAVASAINAGTCAVNRGNEASNWEEVFLNPGEKQCKFCRAKATCPALRDEVASEVFHKAPASPEEFENYVDNARAMGACTTTLESVVACEKAQGHSANPWLAAALSKVDLIEDWCKAVRAETERRMLAGETVPGYKLVQGKRGARQWADAAQAEELLRKVFRLPVEKAYDLKLISPTTAEKLHKAGDIGPRQWPKAQSLITQPEGKLHVAPLADGRPAIEVKPVVEDFDVVDPGAEFA